MSKSGFVRRVAMRLAVCVISLAVVASQATASSDSPEAASRRVSDVAFNKCSIGTHGLQIQAECATLDVALDPDNPALGTLPLALARIKSRRRNEHTDALTFIAGGPGQSAIDTYPSVAFAFRHVARDRDIILVDQRGTGQSTILTCPESPDSLGADLTVDTEQLAAQSAKCLNSMSANPALFTTSIAVHDLESVKNALGISQWNLYGISYGTRVAQHYLKRYPESVRTITLDAVVPAQVSLGPDISSLAQRALDLIFERCTIEEGCHAAFGQLAKATTALLDELKNAPRTISYEDIATGRQIIRDFTRDELAVTLRLMTYSSQTAAILPSMLFEAIANDNFAPLARQSDSQSESLSTTLATGMHQAILCTEDEPFIDSLDPGDTAADDGYLGASIVPSLKATCAPWPAGRIDEDFKQALVSDKPALILSGEADPVTPPGYGDLVAETLSNSLHIVNPAMGHMQAPFGCMPILLAQFIASGNTDQLDTTCLERIRPTPFFIDANGPLP